VDPLARWTRIRGKTSTSAENTGDVRCLTDAEVDSDLRRSCSREAGATISWVIPSKDETEHFVRCPACGGWIDCRDLGQVFEHEGSLPHPAQDQPQ
jgi:hypothetical protein